MYLDIFIQQCINLIDAEKQILLDKDLISSSDLEYSKYKERALGCQTSCPCCGRMCDVEHYNRKTTIGSDTNKHQCTLGHQFRAMNGFKMTHSNEPSFHLCESMNDEDKIAYSGKYITWKQFKTLHPTWSFEVDSQQDVNGRRARCVFIWYKIGKNLCDHFQIKYRAIESKN